MPRSPCSRRVASGYGCGVSGAEPQPDHGGAWRDELITAAPIGLAVVGDDRITEATPRFAWLLDLEPSAVRGASLESVFGGEKATELRNRLALVRAGARTTADVELDVGSPGKRRWLLLTCFRAARLGPDAFGLTLIDITNRRGREDRHVTLQELAAAFAGAVTPDVVGELVIRAVLESVDAVGGVLYLLDDSGTRLTAIVSKHPPPGESMLELDVADDLPACEAVRTRRPVWVQDTDDLLRQFPSVAELFTEIPGWGGHAALPLMQGARVIGALVFSWPVACTFGDDDRSFLLAIADQCSKALHRSEVMRAEREAREHTERVADHVLRLERITGALASASAPDEVIDTFLDKCLDELGASYGAVLVIDEEKRMLVPLGAWSREEPWQMRPLPLDGDTALAATVRTRQPVLLENLDQIRAYAGAEVAHLVDEQAWAIVPLVAYGEVLGALGLRYDGGRHFDADDRALLVRVGRRLGEAIDRSRLFAQQRDAREQAEAAARWLRSVQSMAAALARSATRRDVARALREHLHPATRADYSIVAAVRNDQHDLEVLTGTSSFALNPTDLDESVKKAVVESLMRGRAVEVNDHDEISRVFPALASAGIQSFALLPIRSGRSLVAVLGIGWTRPGGITSEARRLLAIAVSLGGAAFERAAAYDLDHHIADTLQRHLLTSPEMTVPGVAWAARYAPGAVDLTAGGDWYDVIDLGGGRVGVVVGDIVGHGIMAAAAMGQVRSATRALAPRESAVGVLDALDSFVETTGQGSLSSLAYVVLDPATNTAEYAVAGHPPPLLRRPDGSTEFVHDARGPLLGVGVAAPRRSVVRPFEPGSTIVLYTDGLVERRGEPIDEGLADLARVVQEAPPSTHPEGLCDRLLRRFTSTGAAPDDITVLAVTLDRLGPTLRRTYPARLEMLQVIRRDARGWLAANDVPHDLAADVLLASGEACANAIEHGVRGADDDTIEVSFEMDDVLGVVVSVRDPGRWPESARVAERGRGLHIIQSVMDVVDIDSGDDGTTVKMCASLQRG